MEKKYFLTNYAVPLNSGILYSSKYTMEVAGQVGVEFGTINLVERGIREETIKTIENIEHILSKVGWSLENVVKVRIFVTDISNGAIVNEEYKKKFNKDYPTRLMVGVKELPLGALVEMECTAIGDTINEK